MNAVITCLLLRVIEIWVFINIEHTPNLVEPQELILLTPGGLCSIFLTFDGPLHESPWDTMFLVDYNLNEAIPIPSFERLENIQVLLLYLHTKRVFASWAASVDDYAEVWHVTTYSSLCFSRLSSSCEAPVPDPFWPPESPRLSERYRPVTSLQVAPLQILMLTWMKISQRINNGITIWRLFRKPYLIPKQQRSLVRPKTQQIGIMGIKYQLGILRVLLFVLKQIYYFSGQLRVETRIKFIYTKNPA